MSCHRNTMAADILQRAQEGDAPLCFIGVGSNIGADTAGPAETVARAITALKSLSDFPLAASSLWASEPVDCPPGSPSFINAVVALRSRQRDALVLLRELQSIEARFGRARSGIVNEARTLDLDLLSFANVEMATSILTLPHPRAHLRRFVLAPLQELDASLVLPGFSRSVADLLAELDRRSEPQQTQKL